MGKSSATGVRVALAVGHPGYLQGLARAVRADPLLELVAAVGDGEAALTAIAASPVHVALLDLRLPGVGGLESCALIRARMPDVQVALLCDGPTDLLRARAAEAGACALLDKGSPRAEICAQLRAIPPAGDSVV